MKLLKSKALFLISLVVLASCSPKQENTNTIEMSVLNIDLTSDFEETELAINEIVEDIKLIQLESNEDILLAYFSGFIGDKYIVAKDEDKLLYFTADGKFLKTIAIRGEGPNEFRRIDTWVVDEQEKTFLYHDIGQDGIFKFNLETGEFEESIPFETKGSLSGMLLMGDATIALMAHETASYDFLYRTQSFDGKILNQIKNELEVNHKKAAYNSPYFAKYQNSIILLQRSNSDSIYQIKGDEMKPFLLFGLKKIKKDGNKTLGSSASLAHIYKDKFYLRKYDYHTEVSTNSVSLTMSDYEHFVFDNSDNSTVKFSKVYCEYEGIKFPISYLNIASNGKLIRTFDAFEVKELIEEALEEGNLTEKQKSYWEEINSNIDDTDNPIIITGKAKV
ncbi:MAG: hypothetical protein CMO01_14500 [Thalassobius sp.]|nr:hypothetical protein [Thalassovita sp.]